MPLSHWIFGRFRHKTTPMSCSFDIEDGFNAPVCGLDEAGRGPLAGPVVAACVIVPAAVRNMAFWNAVNDSKKLTAKKRETLFEQIKTHCICGIAECDVDKIDQMNILRASLHAMTKAFDAAGGTVDWVALVDGNQKPKLPCAIQTVVKGDSKSRSIAAASILAKVTRDRIMTDLCAKYPMYGWSSNSGYGTAVHMNAIAEHGVTPHHRQSFAPVKRALGVAS